jgi:hypothetical protein
MMEKNVGGFRSILSTLRQNLLFVFEAKNWEQVSILFCLIQDDFLSHIHG